MRNLGMLGIVLALVAGACSDSEKTSDEVENSLAGALTKNVKFENGVIRRGDIDKPDGAADVKLAEAVKAMAMKPEGEGLMSLGVDNPDEGDNAVETTLMQFEGADDHIEVPIDDVSQIDAGAGEDGALSVKHPWVCEEETCAGLCNRRFFTQLIIAIQREDGSISEHGRRDVVLDCTKHGDPDQCEPGEGEGDGGLSALDAGGLDAASGSGGGAAVGQGDAGAALDGGVSVLPPQIAGLSPLTTVAGSSLTLSVSGLGFTRDAVVYLDGLPMQTANVSETVLEATVRAARTEQPGSLAVYVENDAGDLHSRSNTLYLQVDPAPGAPLVYDYSPDNGVAGDTILIIATNLAGEMPEVRDNSGKELPTGALGTISWPGAGSVDTIEVELPEGVATGPITVSNSLGSFKGKIFSVGQNLTRLEGTEITSSSEYNTGQWSKASGADNKLATSFFTAHGDCATAVSCTTKPWFMVTFPSEQTVARIAFRGNREYASGYDFITGKFEVLDADDEVLWEGTYDLPAPDRDLDILLPKAVDDAIAVRFSSLADESDEPGFGELEVFDR